MSEISSIHSSDDSLEDLIQHTSDVLRDVQKSKAAESKDPLVKTLNQLSDSFKNLDRHRLQVAHIQKVDFSKVQQQLSQTIEFLQTRDVNPNLATLQRAVEGVQEEIQNLEQLRTKKVERKGRPDLSGGTTR